MSQARSNRGLAQHPDHLGDLLAMCRNGHLYEAEHWIADGKPLQLDPEAIKKSTRPKTALQIAVETGQHSLSLLLLKSGYRLELERAPLLDMALEARRWDLFDLLLEWGADMNSADVYTVLDTYNASLYERFRASGYDLTHRHEMGSYLGHGTSNRPLLGFVKRHRAEDPKIQQELDIALGYHAREGNEKGVALCLWAGADPHTPAPNLELPGGDEESEDEEDSFLGWTAIEEATRGGHLAILKRLKPDPKRDNLDDLYKYSQDNFIVEYLLTVQPPDDLTSILSFRLLPWFGRSPTGSVEAILGCGKQWSEDDTKRIADLRKSLLKLDDWDLRRIMSLLKKPEVCAPETYNELVRTAKMQERLIAIGIARKPVSQREKRMTEISRYMALYDRKELYKQVWAQPVKDVAKTYGVSGPMLGRVCRALRVPVPPRGYWARVQAGQRVKKPPLPKL